MSKIDPNLLNELKIDHQMREDGGESSRRSWVIPAVFLALVVVALGVWWLRARAEPVQTATAAAPSAGDTAGAVLQATGYITARRRATVSTQITGTLTQVLIEEGDQVKKGQILARLEDNALRASLVAAEANTRAAQAQILQTQAQLVQAEADVQRENALAAQGMVAEQVAEQARTAVAAYAAEINARRRAADAAAAQAVQARVNFDYTIVRAPFSGVITEKAAQVGEIVSPLSAGGGFTRTGIGTIVDMDSLEIDVDVNEAYIGQVKPDMPAEAVLDAYPDWKIPAHVIAIVPSADRGKATVKVRVALEQKDARLVPDMGARVSFLEKKSAPAAEAPKGVLVPEKAVVQNAGHSAVFVVEQGRAVLHKVTPATENFGDRKLLLEGVQAGEQVVVSPAASLRDGDKVADKAR
ncbi:MAG: efflux RND transporter periplasmic adaptor subunit [Betaproteobacteria bacterium]|nr:efflux RND transporter periplasmic adaptor subunit [Betaproteobacteria bacterium]